MFRGNTAAEEPVGGSKLKTRPHRESGEFCDSRAMDDSSKSRTEQNPPATSMPQPAGWLQHAAAASTPGQVKNLPPRGNSTYRAEHYWDGSDFPAAKCSVCR